MIGSNVCCDTLLALTRLAEKKADVDFKNISGTIADLEFYLNLRDTNEAMLTYARAAASASPASSWRTAPSPVIWTPS